MSALGLVTNDANQVKPVVTICALSFAWLVGFGLGDLINGLSWGL